MPLTHAEQNRLIVDHMDLVEPIAAFYRGQKGIAFDELAAEGRVGLVLAARQWNQKASFKTYASHRIHGQIQHFVRDWQPLEAVGLLNAEDEERYYQWQKGRLDPFERWEHLAASPEELRIRFEELAHTRTALSGAMIGLSKRDRAILEARFLREPPQTLESIARYHKISYARTVFLVDRALKRLKKALVVKLALV